jgi:hypothetical protein
MANFTEIAAGPWPKWAYNNLGLVVDLVMYVFFSKTKMIGKFIFYIPQFCKNIWSAKFFAKLYISAVGDGVRDLPPRPTALQPVRLAGGW